MKFKIFTLIFAFCLSINLIYGQVKIINPTPEKTLDNNYHFQLNALSQARFMPADTIVPPILLDTCSQTVFSFLSNGDWGFVGGMNDFGDLEKAQRFFYDNEKYDVLETTIFFASADVVGDGDLTVKIYEVDNDTNGPGNLVGTSDAVKASEIAVDPQFVLPTFFTFSTPATVNGPQFFVSVDFSQLYATADTVDLLMTDIGCGDGNDSWELFSDGFTWLPINSSDSWGIETNFFMIATVQADGTSSTKELVTGGNNRIRLHDAFPNPATQEVTISYDLESSTDLQIEIYSTDGKLIQQIKKSTQPPGQYQELISTKNLTSGTYLYGIVTDKGRLMSKFTVLR